MSQLAGRTVAEGTVAGHPLLGRKCIRQLESVSRRLAFPKGPLFPPQCGHSES